MPKLRGRPPGPVQFASGSTLTRTQADTVYLHDECGLGFAEIARRRNVCTATVMNSYKRGKGKMDAPAVSGVAPAPEDAPELPVDKVERLTAEYVATGGGQVTDKTMASRVGMILDKLLFFTAQDDKVLIEMTPKDKIGAIGTLIDKWQLLRGEPTQITRIEDIRQLDKVGQMLQAEMSRRGLIIEGTATEIVE